MASQHFSSFIAAEIDTLVPPYLDDDKAFSSQQLKANCISAIARLNNYINTNDDKLPIYDRRQAYVEMIGLKEKLLSTLTNNDSSKTVYQADIQELELLTKQCDDKFSAWLLHDLIKASDNTDTIEQFMHEAKTLSEKYWESESIPLHEILSRIMPINLMFKFTDLQEQESQILQDICENNNMSISAIANKYLLSYERVRQIEGTALRILRNHYSEYHSMRWEEGIECEKLVIEQLTKFENFYASHIRCIDKLLEKILNKLFVDNEYVPMTLADIARKICQNDKDDNTNQALLNLLTSHGVLLRKVYFQWSNQAQTFQDNHNLNVCIGHTSIDGVTRCSPEQFNIEPFYDSLIGSCKIITIDSAREYSPDTLIRGPFTLENQPNALHNLEDRINPLTDYILKAAKQSTEMAKIGPIPLHEYVDTFIVEFNKCLSGSEQHSIIHPIKFDGEYRSFARQLETLNEIKIIPCNEYDKAKHNEYVLEIHTFNSLKRVDLMYIKSVLYGSEDPKQFAENGTPIWDMVKYIDLHNGNDSPPTLSSVKTQIKRWNPKCKLVYIRNDYYTFATLDQHIRETPINQSELSQPQVILQALNQLSEHTEEMHESIILKYCNKIKDTVTSTTIPRLLSECCKSEILFKTAPGYYDIHDLEKLRMNQPTTNSSPVNSPGSIQTLPDIIREVLSYSNFESSNQLYQKICEIKPDTMHSSYKAAMKRMLSDGRIRQTDKETYYLNMASPNPEKRITSAETKLDVSYLSDSYIQMMLATGKWVLEGHELVSNFKSRKRKISFTKEPSDTASKEGLDSHMFQQLLTDWETKKPNSNNFKFRRTLANKLSDIQFHQLLGKYPNNEHLIRRRHLYSNKNIDLPDKLGYELNKIEDLSQQVEHITKEKVKGLKHGPWTWEIDYLPALPTGIEQKLLKIKVLLNEPCQGEWFNTAIEDMLTNLGIGQSLINLDVPFTKLFSIVSDYETPDLTYTRKTGKTTNYKLELN